MKIIPASLLRPGQSLIRGSRKLRICPVDQDRSGYALCIELRDGSRVLPSHGDRCNVVV